MRIVGATIVMAACLAAGTAARAQGLPDAAQLQDEADGLPGFEPDVGSWPSSKGSGVFHGNYCGIGDNGPGLPPIDALDLACMHHDACTPSGGIPSCGCNARFARETRVVANSPRQSADLRILASMVERSIALIPCR